MLFRSGQLQAFSPTIVVAPMVDERGQAVPRAVAFLREQLTQGAVRPRNALESCGGHRAELPHGGARQVPIGRGIAAETRRREDCLVLGIGELVWQNLI